jgi:hypothetical protein
MASKPIITVLFFLFLALTSFQSHALLISGQDIITAPAYAIDDPPGAVNDHQQAFDERQNVLLASDLNVDGGLISSGSMVNSHMIFLNSLGSVAIADLGVRWGFDGIILGVMSDTGGNLEANSSALLGAVGTVYPSSFSLRGMESNDSYLVSGSIIEVNMSVVEPGDWIRVITAATSVPEPSTVVLMGLGLAGLGFSRRKKAA